MSILTGKGITKVYGGNEVLHGIDLELESGKIYGLIGRNGAGKTTLLSILTSHNSATAGTVTFDGEPVWENAWYPSRSAWPHPCRTASSISAS